MLVDVDQVQTTQGADSGETSLCLHSSVRPVEALSPLGFWDSCLAGAPATFPTAPASSLAGAASFPLTWTVK